ncbi:MAG: hypothetical protein AAFX10_09600 [Pseudomonadota bacterium]
MKRKPEILPRLLAVAILIGTHGSANADEGVYESVADIRIGRIFLTPAERRRLDQLRLAPPRSAGGAPVAAGVESTGTGDRQRRPAGYIISSSGKRRTWTGDDFVASDGRASISTRFPGDVEVIRHGEQAASIEQGPATDQPAESPAHDSSQTAESKADDDQALD